MIAPPDRVPFPAPARGRAVASHAPAGAAPPRHASGGGREGVTMPLRGLLTGAVRPFGPAGVPSAIHKAPVRGAVHLGREGLAGDAQGDTRHHGGPDKAVHHYPFEHYARWRAELGARAPLAGPGGFGENISTLGLTEEDVAIGDVFRMGGAVVEISEPRQPCWKLNHRFGLADMALRVQASGRTGWYYRVLEEGTVAPGDGLVLLDRRAPQWPLPRLWRLLYVDMLDRDELAALAALALLPEGWRRLAERRLATGVVEDWERRLSGV